ncbi:MAG: GNAT family N-acetyltransferase [Pirellulales bacterium]
MAVNALEIVKLEADRYDRARALLGRAFYDYNLMVYAAPDNRSRLAGVTLLYGALMSDCFRFGEVYVSRDCRGVACWMPPGIAVAGLWRQIRSGMLALPLRFGLAGFRRLVAFDNVAARLHHQHAPMPHWHLSVIGVEPEFQGQGIGSAMMQPMLERADAAAVPCYLDTHQEANVRLYQRHGFEIAERAELSGHPVPVYAMLRKPRVAPVARQPRRT